MAGGYAEFNKVPAHRIVKIPDSITFEQAAAVFHQGLTAHAFTRSAYSVKPGDRILVQAAAGGVGNLLVQMAKNAGEMLVIYLLLNCTEWCKQILRSSVRFKFKSLKMQVTRECVKVLKATLYPKF